MSEQETAANPYNMQKPWHNIDEDRTTDSADTLFFEKPKTATPEEARSNEEEPKETVNYKKRYDDLKKHYDERLAEFKQKEEELRAEIQSNQPKYQPPKSPEELEQFKSKHPELYDTVESVAHMRTQEQITKLQEKIESLEADKVAMTQREALQDLRDRHPDFNEIRSSDEFHAWAKTQPDEIQRWVYNNPNNATLASRAIDLYKLESDMDVSPQTDSKPRKSESAADMVSTKTTHVDTTEPKIWTKREIASLSIDEYDRLEDEIDRAIIEGRVRG